MIEGLSYRYNRRVSQGISREIHELNKRLDSLEDRQDSDDRTPWYKMPSILISALALITSVAFTVFGLFTQSSEKKELGRAEKIKTIESAMERILEEESKYTQVANSPNVDQNSKMVGEQMFMTHLNYYLEQIQEVYDTSLNAQIKGYLLLQYSVKLFNSGRYEEAIEVGVGALKVSKDSVNRAIICRSLANIYSSPGKTQDSLLSRGYRKRDLSIGSSMIGVQRLSFKGQSYYLWALEEYFSFGNSKGALTLLDSALSLYQLLPDHDARKGVMLGAIKNYRHMFIHQVPITNIIGEWNVYFGGNEYGIAQISQFGTGYQINMDVFEDKMLKLKVNGTAQVITVDNLRFNLNIGEILMYKAPPTYYPGTIKLSIENANTLRAVYFRLNRQSKYITFSRRQ